MKVGKRAEESELECRSENPAADDDDNPEITQIREERETQNSRTIAS